MHLNELLGSCTSSPRPCELSPASKESRLCCAWSGASRREGPAGRAVRREDRAVRERPVVAAAQRHVRELPGPARAESATQCAHAGSWCLFPTDDAEILDE